MIEGTLNDKSAVVDILTKSFELNKSVNYIVNQDRDKLKRLQLLMEYSFYICQQSGDIFLSDNRKGCALLLYPDKKKASLRSIFWDLKLALFSVGLRNIPKTLRREAEIKKRHPNRPFAYLWFIGVQPSAQGMGVGSSLLNQVLKHAADQNRDVFLETSTLANLPWYEKFGFQTYDELDLGYKLFFLKWHR
jgi:hypothetical protein